MIAVRLAVCITSPFHSTNLRHTQKKNNMKSPVILGMRAPPRQILRSQIADTFTILEAQIRAFLRLNNVIYISSHFVERALLCDVQNFLQNFLQNLSCLRSLILPIFTHAVATGDIWHMLQLVHHKTILNQSVNQFAAGEKVAGLCFPGYASLVFGGRTRRGVVNAMCSLFSSSLCKQLQLSCGKRKSTILCKSSLVRIQNVL